MQCENIFCIYWEQNQCRLESVSLDELGSCKECINVKVEEELLSKKRAELLEAYKRS